jgi:nucleotide-binding universal stress UspA family protein
MGIRKSVGKNKKSKKQAPAAAVKRDEIRRKAAMDAGKSRPQGMRQSRDDRPEGVSSRRRGAGRVGQLAAGGRVRLPAQAASWRPRHLRASGGAGARALDAAPAERDASPDRGAVNRIRRATARRQVEAAAATLRRVGWRAAGLVRTDLPLAGLLAAVRAARADVLVVGARGTGAVTHFLLGSVAEATLKHAPVDVLIVK